MSGFEVDKAASAPNRSVSSPGSVRLRSVAVALESDIGQAFVIDCSRNVEGVLSDNELKVKWELSDEYWTALASNLPLLTAVRTERERRILSGEAAREAAQRHFAKAPNILNGILTDEQIAPRHRIEAARELRQVAGSGPESAPGPGEKFVINIDLGADCKIVKEFYVAGPVPSEDGEAS